MSTSFRPLEIRRRLGPKSWSAPIGHGPDGWAFVEMGAPPSASIIVSCADQDDGNDWVHASIARETMPTYEDLKLLHGAVFGDGWAYQIFAPPAEHINLHEHALHLWGRLDGKAALPDFTHGSGSI